MLHPLLSKLRRKRPVYTGSRTTFPTTRHLCASLCFGGRPWKPLPVNTKRHMQTTTHSTFRLQYDMTPRYFTWHTQSQIQVYVSSCITPCRAPPPYHLVVRHYVLLHRMMLFIPLNFARRCVMPRCQISQADRGRRGGQRAPCYMYVISSLSYAMPR